MIIMTDPWSDLILSTVYWSTPIQKNKFWFNSTVFGALNNERLYADIQIFWQLGLAHGTKTNK